MSKPLKQIVVNRGDDGEGTETFVNNWLSDRTNDKYDYEITYLPCDNYITTIITYWMSES